MQRRHLIILRMRWRRYALLRSWRILSPDELDDIDAFLDASSCDPALATVRDPAFTART